ncbi:MAG: lipoprotein [Rhodocyclaceae bacterium]|nr:MAG: lipoprotein [Rhodocyclaceae bacterium]TND06185.1 MAG: lipoprotein [Rhodocyclaceae bacterium]
MKLWPAFLLVAIAANAAAQLSDPFGRYVPKNHPGDEEEKPWQELAIEPPAFPRQENLLEFYVSAVATNRYFIDASTLGAGSDGVVRYVLVVKTAGGATNVSFEGMHCKDRTWKHYATGRSDNTWTKSRAARVEWRPIENKPVNRHHAALSRDFFCPMGNAIKTADEGRNALRLGKHPDSI